MSQARAKTGRKRPHSAVRRCRVCGCTDQRACPGGCSWVAADLCSACHRGRRPPSTRGPSAAAGPRCLADVATLANAAMGWATGRRDVNGLTVFLARLPPQGRMALVVYYTFWHLGRTLRAEVRIDPDAMRGRRPAAWVRGLLTRNIRAARRAVEAAGGQTA